MKVKVQNYFGKVLDFQATNDFVITSIEGITPPTGTINTTKVATADGSFYNSGRADERNIVITIVPNTNIEDNRLLLYDFFKSGKKITMFFKTKNRDVFIEGYTENVEGSLYTARQSFQVSVICPQPYFSDTNAKIFSQEMQKDVFTFPFSVSQKGVVLSELSSITDCKVLNLGVASGLIIELSATDTVINPTIYNRRTQEKMELNYMMKSGDTIQIDSRKGKKGITLTENGINKNIIFSLVRESKWLSLESGENLFTFSATYGENNLQVTYKFYTLYEGV